MSALISINNVEVEFLTNNESIFINSLDLGKVFGKEHKTVLRNIENLPNDEFKFSNFIKSEYLNSQNKKQPCYNLTKDGFCFLVMGFTGEKAYFQVRNGLQHKNKYFLFFIVLKSYTTNLLSYN